MSTGPDISSDARSRRTIGSAAPPVAGTATIRCVPAAVGFAALLGAAWGALLPGLVHRYAVEWPVDQRRPEPRLACGGCGAAVRPWPRPAWRCGRCGTRFGPPAALTVPLSTVVCGLLAAAVGARPELPAYLVVGALGVLLAFVDLAVLRLPDRLVLAAFAGCAVLLPTAAVTTGHGGPLLRAVLGAVASQLLYLGLALLPGSQLGWGDVKLGGVLGLLLGWSGWFALAAGLVLPPLLNLPVVVARLANGGAGRKTLVPYGPAMLTGALAGLVLSVLRHGTIA
jgi:leader peptidase (prepilin peptidase)/N-methyltransferase